MSTNRRAATNPDCLCFQYPGEGKEYDLAEEAAQAALSVQLAWQEDCPDEEVFIAHGDTGGMTMPFSPCDREELLAWAKGRDDELPCCDYCGEKITGSWFKLVDWDEQFCREFCADRFLSTEEEEEDAD